MKTLSLALVGFGMLAVPECAMAQADDRFVGQTMTVTFGLCPTGWAEMDGRILEEEDYGGLFALLGGRYGGDGDTTFALPTAKPKYTGNGRMLRQCIALEGLFPRRPD